MSKKFTTTKTCIYCGSQSVSEEHVFPIWLRNRFRGYGTLEHKVDLDSPIRFKTGVTDLRVTVRSVCKKCNENWMSVIQNDTKPLIERLLKDPTSDLDLRECRRLTTWAVMSAMCLETRNAPPEWRYTQVDHTLFQKRREIPDRTEVWICRWDNTTGPSYDSHLMGENHDRAYVVTFGFGTLIFQVLHLVPVDPNDGKTMWISDDLPWDDILIPIRHPRGSTASLAGKRAIDGEQMSLLESRFSRPQVKP